MGSHLPLRRRRRVREVAGRAQRHQVEGLLRRDEEAVCPRYRAGRAEAGRTRRGRRYNGVRSCARAFAPRHQRAARRESQRRRHGRVVAQRRVHTSRHRSAPRAAQAALCAARQRHVRESLQGARMRLRALGADFHVQHQVGAVHNRAAHAAQGQAARRTGYELQDSRGNAEDRAASSQVADGRGVYGVGRRGVTLQGDHRPCGERR